MIEGNCHHCGSALEYVEKVFRSDTCPECDSDIYCCYNCRDYDSRSPNECREPSAERVSVKDRRNYCEYYTLKKSADARSGADKAAEARKKLEALFGSKRK